MSQPSEVLAPFPGAPTRSPAEAPRQGLHAIVVVGGGAGGLELVTRLGDKLGRRGKAAVTLIEKKRTHLWKPLLHEVAAGSMDIGMHELDYLAQAHWHGFRYRVGEMSGIARQRRLVQVGPFSDEEGIIVTERESGPYGNVVIPLGLLSHQLGTPGAKQH